MKVEKIARSEAAITLETSRHDPAEQRAERYALEAMDVAGRLIAAEKIIRELVETARPAFPRSPFRAALDKARAFLPKEEASNDSGHG